MKNKRVPLRKCLGCNEMKPKFELVRVVKNKDLDISIDINEKKPGRGAYVCKNIKCFEKLKKIRRLEKTFSCKIPEEVYVNLEKELQKYE